MRIFGRKSSGKTGQLASSPLAEADPLMVPKDQEACEQAGVSTNQPAWRQHDQHEDVSIANKAKSEAAVHSDGDVAVKINDVSRNSFSEIRESERRLTAITHQYNEARLALQSSLFAQRDAVNSSIQAVRTKRQEVLKQQDALVSQLDCLQSPGNQKLIAQRDELTAKMNSALAQLDMMKTEQAHHRQELSHLDEQIQVTKQATESILESLKAIGAKIRQVEEPTEFINTADANRKTISEMHSKLDRLNQRKVALETTKRRVAEIAKDFDQSIAQCNATLETDRRSVRQVAVEIQAAHKNHQAEITEVKEQLEGVRKQLNAQEEVLSDYAAQKQHVDEEIHLWLGAANQITKLQFDKDVPVFLVVDSFAPDQQDVFIQLATKLEHGRVDKVHLYFGGLDVWIADKIQTVLDKVGLASAQVNICNPLFQLQNTKAPVKKAIKLPKHNEETWNDDHTIRTVKLEQAAFVLKVTYRDTHEKQIADIAYYTNDKLVKQTSFNREGILLANAFYNANEFVTREEYYRDDGANILTTYYQDGQLVRLELIDGQGLVQKSFNTVAELNQWWLQTYTDNNAEFIGSLDNQEYRDLIVSGSLTAIPYISEATSPEIVAKFSEAMLKKRFVVANHDQQEMVYRQIDDDLEMLVLDETYLPVSLATPSLEIIEN